MIAEQSRLQRRPLPAGPCRQRTPILTVFGDRRELVIDGKASADCQDQRTRANSARTGSKLLLLLLLLLLQVVSHPRRSYPPARQTRSQSTATNFRREGSK